MLITLGIIGVVAAMTLPALINKTNNKDIQAQFKKTYSELNQVAQLFLKDNEISVTDYVEMNSTSLFVKNELQKYYKGVQLIDDTTFGSTDEEGNKKSSLYPVYSLNGARLRMGPCDDLGFRTESGGRVFSFVGDKVQPGQQGPVVCADVNGHKGPNKYGYDIFLFRFTRTGFVLPMGQEASPDEVEYGSGGDATSSNFFFKDKCKSASSVSLQFSCAYYALADRHPTEPGKNYWQDFLGTSR